MRLDNFNIFSWNQSLGSGATYSDNTLDFGSVTSKLSASAEPWSQLERLGSAKMLIQVTEAFVGGGSVGVSVHVSDDPAFTTYKILVTAQTITSTDLIVGFKFDIIDLPEFSEQYLQIGYLTTSLPTAGKITAGIVLDRQTNK